MILVLFTASFPYARGGEGNFLAGELPYLLRAFERVILVPERLSAEAVALGPRVTVEDGFAGYLRAHGARDRLARGLSSSQTYAELGVRPWLLLRPSYLKRLVFFAGQAELVREWVKGWLHASGLASDSCLFYTYWFYDTALGLGMLKRDLPGIRLISRAHGYDVYEERHIPPYFPCRAAALASLDALFPISDSGRRHLCSRYPAFERRIETQRLGVADPGFRTAASADGAFRIVSCSRILPIKRLGLMLQGILAAARQRPEQHIEWQHIGDGDLPLDVREGLQQLPRNLTVEFMPYRSRDALFEFYRSRCVDVFLNVSASEGVPMALMEAASCSIPLVATDVGGTREIVSASNGVLLDPDPAPTQIASALLELAKAPGGRRAASRAIWQEKYDSRRNYPAFAQRLEQVAGRGV